jgi:hypothetical protein
MPYGNGAGPAGMGPMTGRGAGFCAGYGQPGYMSPLPGRGARPYGGRGMFGRHGGQRFLNGYYAAGMTGWQRAAAGYPAAYGILPAYDNPAPEQELAVLRNQIKFMEDSVKKTQERIQELEQQAPEK